MEQPALGRASAGTEIRVVKKRVAFPGFGRPSPALWLNLVCLDAPLVAVAWQALFAREFRIPLAPASQVILFLTVWIIYLADRFADSWLFTPGREIAQRHLFCQSHRVAWASAIVVLAILAAGLTIAFLDRATLHLGVRVGTVAAIYLATNLWLCGSWRILPIKEISIGLLFATGTVLALVPKAALDFRFLTAAGLFAALCCFNCISIAAWERELDRLQGKTTLLTRWPSLHKILPAALGIFAVSAFLTGFFLRDMPWPICLCASASALLLGYLDLGRAFIPRDSRTALADLVLLTPVLVFACHAP